MWWIFQQIHQQGLVYLGHKVVPHCPRCGTALSSHEVAQGYKLVKENSVYLNFKLLTGNALVKSGDIVLAWTTTPWTLPGNVALAVGEKIEYVKILYQEKNYILAKDRLSIIPGEYQILNSFLGADLVGLTYQPLFNIAAIQQSGQKSYYITDADFVTTADGTGVVHTAVMYGDDDYQLGEKIGLPKVHTVGENGLFTDDLVAYDLAGRFVKDPATEKIIIDYLQNNDLLWRQEEYEHDYPFCWRCDTPLLYYAKDSWFIRMSDPAVKSRLLKNAATINWVPQHIKEGRFGEWLTGVKDWAISRERYWGTPLPIWICDQCQEQKVIGSIKELQEFASEPLADNIDLHRPAIDQVFLRCPHCASGKMSRVKEVMDCWFDSGAMPFAQHHYPFANQELIDQKIQYPANYISEAIDQTRGWFYTLLAISSLLDKGSSYLNVICLGHINDKFGRKMSKSKGNIIDPWQVIDQFGVDAVRLHLYTINQPGEGKNYDLKDVQSVFRQNLMILWNVYEFYSLYAAKSSVIKRPKPTNVLDQWILACLDQLITNVTTALNEYHVYEAAREIPLLINDLSTWYLRRSRDRFKSSESAEALATLEFVLLTLSKVMAPFTPFIAEHLYQQVSGLDYSQANNSVHLATWPELVPVEETVIAEMSRVRKLVELGLAARDQAGIKVRQPLNALLLPADQYLLPAEYQSIVQDELNVKNIIWSDQVQVVTLDVEITPALRKEGYQRELIRQINSLRKKAGLTIADQVILYWQTTDSDMQELLSDELARWRQAVLVSEVQVGENQSGLVTAEVIIADKKIILTLIKK